MRMGPVRAGAWAAATAAAVSVAWLGVHRVLGDSSYEQPRMLVAVQAAGSPAAPPLPTAIGSASERAQPTPGASATAQASRSPAPRHSPGGAGGTGSTGGTGGTGGTSSSGSNSSSGGTGGAGVSDSGDIQSYTRPGGRIVVAMGASSASLVSATADTGWSMHTWTGDDWLRVDFDQGTADSIFYVTWNGHAPMVQTWGP
ncbi:hypothetical protein GXW83_05870 [Streptacidiphilus sp. PB12-B1b]|uniref:hypothetical protein n=1 Tax=Streptacidiphilus sp. PB12-B1b TaxID=2705012 RepID=UPI0015F826B1|nr:hypothetical protein [Streptacidiphilus sp. PB12-B1b]QMU75352.1 hypothetical protein GXW83_05870 [Streptacidiphilus sp. PB12-B1b]